MHFGCSSRKVLVNCLRWSGLNVPNTPTTYGLTRKRSSEEDRRNPNIVARGYTDYVVIQDYPLRGRPVYLHMRKNKWWNKLTNEIFSYNLELPNEDGTRLTAEFVSFLKDEGRDDGVVD